MLPGDRKVIATERAPKALGPYSVAVQTGSLVFTSGQVGLDPVSNSIVEGGIEAETRQVLTNLRAVLEASGSSLANVVKTTVFLRDMNEFARMNAVYAEFFVEKFPARSTVQVGALPKGAAVEIEAVAVMPGK
jgi:2-iminobutanoate/2-iminopropanoate deaminase